MAETKNIQLNICLTRCYLNVLGEVYYCVASILKDKTSMSVKIESDFMPDDGFDQHVSLHMKNITKEVEKCRLFHGGSLIAPCLIDKAFIYKGATFRLQES